MTQPAAEPSTAEWTPEFEGQRPPFEDGNEAAVKHGAHSARRVESIAKRVNDELLERFPVVADYPETLTALARVEGVTRLLFADIATNGLYDRKGNFRASLLARFFTSENTGAKLRASLGMTPQSVAEVARDRAAAAASAVDVVGELIRQGRSTQRHPQTSDGGALGALLQPEAPNPTAISPSSSLVAGEAERED